MNLDEHGQDYAEAITTDSVESKEADEHHLRGVFFNSCHLLDYFSHGLTTRMLFMCGERSSLSFSDQIRIKIVAL